ncbi:nose resistant to fluoxetine protein 6-like [Neocloeon triangulifer]|uniref:nose resistant to fluoxetine protein 6-like n=1 Tax=Neocloeon triangulifer TaxID=2078957 RepID=UPI00286F187F|nr:nose resistant to fluoxetine protein 6-like [Neocloeon triangulifer]
MAQTRNLLSLLCLLVLVSGHRASPSDANRTHSVIFSPVRSKAVPLVQPEPKADDGFDYFSVVSRFLPTSSKVSEACRLDSLAVLQAVKTLEPWALKMIDATAKLPSGLLYGNIKSYGQFDECLAVVSKGQRQFTGQYCLANVHLKAYEESVDRILDAATLRRRPLEITYNRTNMPVPDLLPSMALFQFASCVPSSCTPEDVQIAMTEALQWAVKPTGLRASVQVYPESCTTLTSKPFTKGEVAMILVIIIFLLLVFLSSAYDIAQLNYVESESPIGKAMVAFSVPRNWTRLFKLDVTQPGVIGSLDGIRVFSTLWVIMTHKILYFAQEPWINKLELVEALSSLIKMPLINTLLNVDTFLLISGLLKAYHYLRDLENKRFSFISCYTRRYLRLTPAYMVVLGFYATLLVRLSSGPAWNKFVEQPTDACKTNWFYNLIYLNNYIDNRNQCMVQTWYLAMDFQLCLLAPLIVYPLWKWPNVGKFLFTSVALLSIAIPFLTIYCSRAIPSYILGASDIDIEWYMQNIYFVTHQRASPYIIGLALGYIFYRLNTTKVKLSKVTVAAGWALCLAVLYAVVFGSYDIFQYGRENDSMEAALYGGLHRPAWALAVGWIIFACNCGYGGWITTFLSARVFQPLSKLSYSIFLTHYIVLMVNTGRMRTAVYVDEYTLLHMFLGDILLVFAISLVLYLFVEAPLFELVKICYGHKKGNRKSLSSTPAKNELDSVHVNSKIDTQLTRLSSSPAERP